MIKWLIAVLGLALALPGCATRPAAPPTLGPVPAWAEVARDSAGWTVTFHLPRPRPAWAFIRSAPIAGTDESWRVRSWTVETPGVRLARLGRYDALVAERGDVPARVRIRFTPFTEELRADYVPALALTDGTVALFDDHFLLFSAASTDAVAALPPDLNGQPIEDSGTRVSFRDAAGPLLHRGRRLPQVTTRNASSYIIFGARDPVVTEAMAAVIDPGLPPWLAETLRELVPAILSRHAAALGPAPGGAPLVLAGWAGPTPAGYSMNGGVVPGTIVMRFNGAGVLRPNAEIVNVARWFVAHEGAHFWLGQAVRYERSADAWMMEGGADLLAIRTVQAIDPAYDWKGELNRAIRDCATALSRGGVSSAQERGENRPYYDCGAIFALVAEAKSGRPFSAFVRQLVDANRADGVLTRAEWLEALGDVGLRRQIEFLLDQPVAEPGRALARLLATAGVAHRLGPDGVPILS